MSTLGAVPVMSVAQASEVNSRQEASQARATRRSTNATVAANADKAAKTATATSPSNAMGSLAMATTVTAMMSSMPAALHLMTHAALSTGRDKPHAASHSIAQDDSARITQRVASPGGSAGTGARAGSSSTGQRGGSSSGDAFAGDAAGAEAPQAAADTSRDEPQLSSIAPLAVATASANANPVAGSAVAALAALPRNAGGSAMQVVEDAPKASPSTLSGMGVRQAIALFKQHATSIRIPMSVVAIVA